MTKPQNLPADVPSYLLRANIPFAARTMLSLAHNSRLGRASESVVAAMETCASNMAQWVTSKVGDPPAWRCTPDRHTMHALRALASDLALRDDCEMSRDM